ncbi:MAG: hypothetical protein CL921_00685 [Deltaproteobacteria bacterium]|nr:hypothetical protein [Deltaproteobacteria bacterium]
MISTQKINFVAFHIDINQVVLKQAQDVAKAVNNENHEDEINLMFSSVKRLYPNAQLFVLTDQKSKHLNAKNTQIIQYELDNRFPIFSRNKAWYEFLKETEIPTIFLDSDILIQSNFDKLMQMDFDIAFTFRNWEKWPINLGIIYVKNNHENKAEKFFKDWYQQFKVMKEEQKVWGGDQDLIHIKFKDLDFSVKNNFDFVFDQYKIKFLKCNEYNYSSEINEPMYDYPINAKVLHFKGARKKYMLNCWEKIRYQKIDIS